MAVKTAKRIIIDYGNNLELAYSLSHLRRYYTGMSNAEIVKVALAELFQSKVKNMDIVDLSEEQEASLAKAMKDPGGFVSLDSEDDIKKFIKSL